MSTPVFRVLAVLMIPGFAMIPATGALSADMDPVGINAPEKQAWVGQRFPFFVELRGTGPFVGAAGFSLPQIPRTVIVRIGNPTVSSKEEGDKSWFIQTHEFALFSQAAGDIEIPPFEVRFSYRDGFTGPQVDQVKQVPALKLAIQQPPGSGDMGFLVTTGKLTVSERWDPQPGQAQLGAVFRRVITQQADQMTGMALAPPPTTASAGIRVYTEDPVVTDKTERGEFSGSRRDSISYQLQHPGTQSVPAIRYVWWDPEKKEFGSHTLPGVTFQVPAPPAEAPPAEADGQFGRWLLWGCAGLIPVAVAIRYRRAIARRVRAAWASWHPPERVAARRLLKAGQDSDARAALTAWQQWRNTRPADFTPLARLAQEIMILERCFYGRDEPAAWRGTELVDAFREQLTKCSRVDTADSDLPALNPMH